MEYVLKTGFGTSPFIEAVQEEYEESDLKKVKIKIENVLNALKHLEEGKYQRKDFEEIERVLEGLANRAASRSSDLIARAGRYSRHERRNITEA